MKKLILLSATVLFFATFANAQTDATEVLLKKDISNLNSKEATIEKEIKADKTQANQAEIANLNEQKSRIERQKKADKSQLRKVEAQEVTYQAKQQFIADFGDVPVTKSQRTNYFEEFVFNKDGQDVTAFYDTDEKLVGTSVKRNFDDVPSKARLYILNKYADYTIGDVIFYDDNEANETDMVMYNQSFGDADNYFVELKKGNEKIAVKVDMEGEVSYFTEIK